MRVQVAATLLAAAGASAQSVVGTAYGFATGVTGGGDAEAVTVSSVDELTDLLSDDTARVIIIDGELDFTGTTATGAGCDRVSCSSDDGGQLYLGELSCTASSDNLAVNSITYDTAGPEPLQVGSNKSILGLGTGVLVGKGLELADGASNVIIQGLEIKNLNPGVVWGGDALGFAGNNDGVWVDHNKFSAVGRMFIVSHYAPSRLTISNNEFDGTTTTSATCNGNHYWTMMFYGDGDQVTLDRNYYHDVSGRAPKLGEDGTTGTFHAVNNYFSNMQGHAFDTYEGASALIEGNVFEAVSQPNTDKAAESATLYTVPDEAAASACADTLGRACAMNSVDSSSGELVASAADSVLGTMADVKDSLVEPIDASEVAAYVVANAGPANLGSSGSSSDSSSSSGSTEEEVQEDVQATPTTATPSTTPISSSAEEVPTTTTEPASSASVTASPSIVPSSESPSAIVSAYGQCGGLSYTGATACVDGYTCTVMNEWYSQCIVGSAKFRRAVGGRW